ncbi:1-deoxy-D-xylulose-5-phosphate synthase [bacterium]|nr:1-deoxy-D-xylulose-5-phosphate synthase [bacterium]
MLKDIDKLEKIKKLKIEELEKLAQEVRERIIEVTSQNGGHVAPSLGATDLVIALLKVFTPPEDAIVWDVGHQSYAYKILTGRNADFDTLRQYQGISGFNNMSESKYDAFGVGHSSTSISAALGIACGKQINQETGHSIAIIGDGALTGGMSFEALNHAGHLSKDKLLVILNDNNMSISKNVGALQKYLTNMLVSRSYNALKKQVWDFSSSLPRSIRTRFIRGAQKMEESMINILVPNIIFEDLGFKYVGPVDGHNISRLIRVLNKVKYNMVGPVLLHVVTKKGKGLSIAENNSSKFHGLGPYNASSGETEKRLNQNWSISFGEKLSSLANENKKIVAITAAMSDGTGLTQFEKKYPSRFFDVGIAEQHAITFAGGLATKGIKPFVAVYSTFIQRAYDQIIHDIALQKLPLVICLDRAGLVGEDGATHHGAFDISFLLPIPNLVILTPAYETEFHEMLTFASNYQDGPIIIRYPRGTINLNNDNHTPFELGKFALLESGKRVAILSVGHALDLANQVRDKLQEDENITAELVNLRTIKPLDYAYLDTLRDRFDLVVTLEHNSRVNGIGQMISNYLSSSSTSTSTSTSVLNIGYPDNFVTHGDVHKLYQEIGFTSEALTEKILKELK